MNNRIAGWGIALLILALPLYPSDAQALSPYWPAGNYSDEGVQYGYHQPACTGYGVRGTTALEVFRKMFVGGGVSASWKDRRGKCRSFWELRDQAAIDLRASKNYVMDNVVIEVISEAEWRLGSTSEEWGDLMTTADIPHDEEMPPEASQAAHPGVILVAKLGGRILMQQAVTWLWRDIQRVQLVGEIKRMVCGHSTMG
ncbi:MAG: hypothetical protein F4013_03685 [Gammaproteobacteria bacterium]|nr:hypothetical protein [Gammaproteobacteria bacterium]